jgi:hypothetical protein
MPGQQQHRSVSQDTGPHRCVWWQGCDHQVILKCGHCGAVRLAQKSCLSLRSGQSSFPGDTAQGSLGPEHTQVGTSDAFKVKYLSS